MTPIVLTGTWLLQVDIVTETRIPVFGEVRMTSRSVSQLEIERRGERWFATQRVCELEMIGGGPARTWMPEAFVEAMPETVYEIEVGPEGALLVDPGPSWIGQEPDGTVVDFEGDGHPGATVFIDIPLLGRAELYFVQHGHTRLVGRFDEQGASGRVEVVVLEQRNLGATHKVVATERPGRVVAEESVFTLRRAPGGKGCGR